LCGVVQCIILLPTRLLTGQSANTEFTQEVDFSVFRPSVIMVDTMQRLRWNLAWKSGLHSAYQCDWRL